MVSDSDTKYLFFAVATLITASESVSESPFLAIAILFVSFLVHASTLVSKAPSSVFGNSISLFSSIDFYK